MQKKKRRAAHREEKWKERGDKGLTLNLLVSIDNSTLIYIGVYKNANGLRHVINRVHIPYYFF